ncbi:hypothetical protein ASG49_11885 [Marmoricola sp. Leaf446]|nr:hypothetical protein ASG49_11885 [Marmoricola sp. Leaf446]
MAVDFFAGDFFAGDFLAEDVVAEDVVAADFFVAADVDAPDFFAADFVAVDFVAVDFLAVDFLAVDFAGADFFAVDFFVVDFFVAGEDEAEDFFVEDFPDDDFVAGAGSGDPTPVARRATAAAWAMAGWATAGAAASTAARVSAGSFLAPETTSRSWAPGLKAGTAFSEDCIRTPVEGLRTQRAPRTRFSNEPKPVMATFSPLATSRVIVSSTESRAWAAALRLPSNRAARVSISWLLFTLVPFADATTAPRARSCKAR